MVTKFDMNRLVMYLDHFSNLVLLQKLVLLGIFMVHGLESAQLCKAHLYVIPSLQLKIHSNI